MPRVLATYDTMDQYIAAFEQVIQEVPEGAIRSLRQEAFERFKELGFPTTKVEDWKYTDTAFLARTEFHVPEQEVLTDADIEPFLIPGFEGRRLVFLDGRYQTKVSDPSKLPDGVTFGNLLDAMQNTSEVLNALLGTIAPHKDYHYAALNTAFFQDGLFLHVPKNIAVETPIQLIFLTSGKEAHTLNFPRNLIVLEEGAQATVVETYGSLGDQVTFTDTVTEIIVRDNAHLDHTRLQIESDNAWSINLVHAEQGRDSRYTNNLFSLGGRLTRNDTNSRLNDEGILVEMNGLYLTDREQLIDNHTLIDHRMPHCASREVYKGILNDTSRAVFNGKVFVRQDAQKTDGQQSNKNLLLDDNARVDTKPQLEIFADDVRCTHGATVGTVDALALFYLRSRGLPKVEAEKLLVHAFAAELADSLKDDAVREYVITQIDRKLER